jgi:hypothetical protein
LNFKIEGSNGAREPKIIYMNCSVVSMSGSRALELGSLIDSFSLSTTRRAGFNVSHRGKKVTQQQGRKGIHMSSDPKEQYTTSTVPVYVVTRYF